MGGGFFHASNSNFLDADVTTTVASAHVYNGGVEITSQYAESSFEWSRNSGNTTADATWNAAHKGMKSVTIKKSELSANTLFTCTLTKIQPCCGDIVVDEDGNLLYAASENGDVFFLDEDGYLCVENPKNSYKLDGTSLYMDTTTSLGTVTATSWVYTASGSDKIVEFKYNAAGLRVQKDVTVDGVKTTTKYILNGTQLTEFQHGDHILKFAYDAQNKPAKVCFDGIIYTYVHNLQGDIVGIVDSSGNLVVEYKYNAWGKLLATIGTYATTLGKLNPFRYRGYIYDEETWMYWLKSRYYYPELHRFINADVVLGQIAGLKTHNAYTYCYDDPVCYSDPSGNSAIDAYNFYQNASSADGPYPWGDLIGAAGALLIYLWGMAFSQSTPTANTSSNTSTQNKPTVSPSPSPTPAPTAKPTIAPTATPGRHQEYFPENPLQFAPFGLIPNAYPPNATTAIVIKWSIPGTKISLFEWDNDLQYEPHYHVLLPSMKNEHLEGGHYKPGDMVPEPWNSLFFGNASGEPWKYLE